MYKNFLMTFMQIFFAFHTYFTFRNIYNDWYQSWYNLIFTTFLVPFTALVNKDLPSTQYSKENNLLIESYMYVQGQQARLFNVKKFLFWFFTSLMESAYIYFFIMKFCELNYHYQHQIDFNVFSFMMFFSIFFQHIFKVLFITW